MTAKFSLVTTWTPASGSEPLGYGLELTNIGDVPVSNFQLGFSGPARVDPHATLENGKLGYGGVYTLDHDADVAIVGVGYGDGLYLLVQPSGAKWWRFDYRFASKRKTLSMGVYPDVSLKQAR